MNESINFVGLLTNLKQVGGVTREKGLEGKREKRNKQRQIVYICLTYIERENRGEINTINHEIAKKYGKFKKR
jgi:hypothetical protein